MASAPPVAASPPGQAANQAPSASIGLPAPGTTYRIGSVVAYAGSASITFFVRSIDTTRAATADLTVVDGCGEWRTFVGGGPDAFR